MTKAGREWKTLRKHFKVQPKFLGIRNIVSGAHYLHWTPLDEGDETVLGHFLYFVPGQVQVCRWCLKTDTFQLLNEVECEPYEAAVRRGELLLNVAVYSNEWVPRWKEVTYYITEKVIHRIEPVHKLISSSTKEYDQGTATQEEKRFKNRLLRLISQEDHDHEASLLEDEKEDNMCGTLSAAGETEEPSSGNNDKEKGRMSRLEVNDAGRHVYPDTLFFCEIPKCTPPPNASGAELTQVFHDQTHVLTDLIDKQLEKDWTQVLGELQLAFVCFLWGQNYQAYEAWKSLVKLHNILHAVLWLATKQIVLLCSCNSEALQSYSKLYCGLCRVLHNHLLQLPDDFFSDILLSNNFLLRCLGNLSELSDASPNNTQFKKRLEYLKHAIHQKFKLTLEELLQLDDAPMVVDPDAALIAL